MTDASVTSDTPQRTDPRGFVVMALTALLQGGLPAMAGLVGTGVVGMGLLVVLPVLAAILAVSMGVAWLKWHRLTYTTGRDNIRVEQGLLSRHARAVPYERIQDVSLEQKLLPRLLGLAEVKFETGAGGKDELSLTYLSLAEAERLRELVRERKGLEPSNGGVATVGEEVAPAEAAAPVLFAMDDRRVLTFGLFEFSLVVFAVLLGAAQQFDFLLPFNVWSWDAWTAFASSHKGDFEWIGAAGRFGAALLIAAGVLAIAGLGVLTGIARTFAREYCFTLERTAKGFRRRRGLFTRTDVVMPVHRVQAARIATGIVRSRFGWQGLEFVSLASDQKNASHAVAPFARIDEIAPVVREAGFRLPDAATDWHRPSSAYWIDRALLRTVPIGLAAVGFAIFGSPWIAIGLGLLAAFEAVSEHHHWKHDRNALDGSQVFVRRGWLAPHLDLASRVKVQSAEIVQGPLARRRGYATLRFGIAGGRLAMPGVPLGRAREISAAVIDSAAAVDFSALPR